jgi:hypothetical protein
MQKQVFPPIDVTVKNLQISDVVPSLARNTPAMPRVASAAKHKLRGFFLPGFL